MTSLPLKSPKLSHKLTAVGIAGAAPNAVRSAFTEYAGIDIPWIALLALAVAALFLLAYVLVAPEVPEWLKTIGRGDEQFEGWWEGTPKSLRLGVLVIAAFMVSACGAAYLNFKKKDQTAQNPSGSTSVSTDARAELARLGIKWTTEELMQAIRRNDARAVQLFLASGMRIETPPKPSYGSPTPNLLFMALRSSPEIHDLLKAEGAVSPGACVPNDWGFGVDYLLESLQTSGAESLYVSVCDNDEARKGFDDLIEPLKAEQAALQETTARVELDRKQCITRLPREWPVERLATVSDPASIIPNQTIGDAPEEYLAAEMQRVLMTGAVTEAAYSAAVRSACERFYSVKPVENQRLEQLETLRAKLR